MRKFFIIWVVVLLLFPIWRNWAAQSPLSPNSAAAMLLSEPFLQLPTETAVRVVWFTEFPGSDHRLHYGDRLQHSVPAATTQMSRLREDAKSHLVTGAPPQVTPRPIWRHEAIAVELTPGQRVPYQVISVREDRGDRETLVSPTYRLGPAPQPGAALKILLTSDHQLKPMVAANLQKVVETIGQPDGVFFPGDLANVPDRASEWFDDSNGGAFFPCLQGRASYELTKNGVTTRYHGGEILQYAPLFAAVGNHEVMGRFSQEAPLDEQFADAYPRWQARKFYEEKAAQINPGNDPFIKANWLKNQAFNTDTYEEIFTFPEDSPGGKTYYAVTFGDIRLISLYATHIWRSPGRSGGVKGRYRERDVDLNNPWHWGFGQHIFEPIAQESLQYQWLEQELQSAAFRQAKYKIVMLHHPPHTLGENGVPPYTDPIPVINRNPDGTIESIRYDYPKDRDYLIQDLVPLLESAGVQLVLYGHSHLWNRFRSPGGVHYLETSNVGNSYGAYLGEKKRNVWPDNPDYAAVGNPNGLEAIAPSLAPLRDENGNSLPYIASNDITVFSIFDTSDGSITSYRFDTRLPDGPVVAFDRFFLGD